MAWGWLRVIETIGDLVDVGRKVRRASSAVRGDSEEVQRNEPRGLTSALGQMETRLTGVLIGALQEAFDRDRARLDLERERVDAEQQRAKEALRLEAERQAAERALAERRLMMIAAIALWITSATVAVVLPGMRQPIARVPLGLGWASLIGAIALAGRSRRFTQMNADHVSADRPASRGTLAQGFLLGGFALIALAIVLAL